MSQFLIYLVLTMKAMMIQMSKALWCDPGQHAFSATDKGKTHFVSQEEIAMPWGEPKLETIEIDVCGPCKITMGLDPKQMQKAIQGGVQDAVGGTNNPT